MEWVKSVCIRVCVSKLFKQVERIRKVGEKKNVKLLSCLSERLFVALNSEQMVSVCFASTVPFSFLLVLLLSLRMEEYEKYYPIIKFLNVHMVEVIAEKIRLFLFLCAFLFHFYFAFQHLFH